MATRISLYKNINISIKIVPASDVAVVNQLTKKLVQTQAEYAIYENREIFHIHQN